jgi:Protein of unknown function (DUF3618)
MGQGAGEVTDAQRRYDDLDADAASSDPEVEQLVGDIEMTREEMTVTVEEIGDRLDPKNIVQSAKETVRDATVGKVEDMASTAGAMVSDAGDTVRDVGGGVVDTVTRNPIPAAMVAIGLGWLAMSRRSNGGGSSVRYRYAGRYAGAYPDPDTHGDSSDRSTDTWSGQGDPSPVEQVQQRAGDVAEQVQQRAGAAADQVGRLAGQVPYQVDSLTRQIGDNAGRMFNQNPLAVGAIAVAVGTAVGLVLPATETERRAIGQPARQALGKAEEAATEALGQAEQTVREAEDQARDEDRLTRPH